jgi:WD40 repeat protein
MFSPDGSYILTQGNDATIRLWNSNGAPIATLQHEKLAGKMAISPDSRFIVTQDSNAIRLWDAAGQELAVFRSSIGDFSPVVQIGFSPTSDEVVVVDQGIIWRYPLQIPDLLRDLECRLPRNLTQEEIERFNVPQPLRFDVANRQCP